MRAFSFGKVLLLLATNELLCAALDVNCSTKPLVLPIKNVTIPSGKIRRGLEIQVGTPATTLAFQPKWDNNNSYIFGPKCIYDDFIKTPQACETFRGGLFDPEKSTSKGSTNQSFVPPQDLFPNTTYTYFTDTLSTGGKGFLNEFPVGQPTNTSTWSLQGNDPMNIIGMSSGSLFLNTLYSTGRIASRSFGYFWGLDGAAERDQLNGSFILGGYDRSKTIGTPYTGNIVEKENCPSGMTVSIRDMALNFRDGRDKTIFLSKNPANLMLACVHPELPVLMSLPGKLQFELLMNQAQLGVENNRSTGIHWWNVITDPQTTIPYDGDFTIYFDGGLQITVPNRLFIVPETKIDDQGDIVASNTSQVIVVESLTTTTAKSMPKIGRDFFSLAYLQSNHDAGKFSIWKLNPTTDEDIVGVDEKNQLLAANPACAAAANSSSPDKGSQPGAQAGKALPIGTLVGIVVGGVAALALIGVLIWYLVRKYKAKKSASGKPKGRQSYNPKLDEKVAIGVNYYDQSQRFQQYDQRAPQYDQRIPDYDQRGVYYSERASHYDHRIPRSSQRAPQYTPWELPEETRGQTPVELAG